MVAQQQQHHALVPYEDYDESEQGPVPGDEADYITLIFNDLPMRFKATRLRPALDAGIARLEASFQGSAEMPLDGKTRAVLLGLRQTVAVALPLLRPLVNAARNDSHMPPFITRMLPEMPKPAKHEDRVMFLVRYLSDVLYAVLTQNAWALDVEPDPEASAEEPDALRVRAFRLVVPAELLQAEEE